MEKIVDLINELEIQTNRISKSRKEFCEKTEEIFKQLKAIGYEFERTFTDEIKTFRYSNNGDVIFEIKEGLNNKKWYFKILFLDEKNVRLKFKNPYSNEISKVINLSDLHFDLDNEYWFNLFLNNYIKMKEGIENEKQNRKLFYILFLDYTSVFLCKLKCNGVN
ncbi:hypothetical protein MM236_01205 [Belliella sp. DSM 107340]|uniref:Uncharacterized protein n=1 Tax=Belliella calami TaxID=2923436 RepID=A0ABS9UJN8_9BACT|nr:hypothetical protein [Belliella calami]MCH7396579.1 hypothetical protein [Belliella calami]